MMVCRCHCGECQYANGLADARRSRKLLQGMDVSCGQSLVRKIRLLNFQGPLRRVINPSLMATLSPMQAPISLQLYFLPPFAYLVLEVGWTYQVVTATRGE